jgi:two-component system response regulator
MASPRHILIIEDNPDDEALLMRQLKKAEMDEHVKAIHDGGKALKFLLDPKNACEKLAAVFLDLKLPTIGGLDILAAIRADERLQDLSVIVMTSAASQKDMDRCRDLGATNFASKPLTFASFAKAFAETFNARRLGARDTKSITIAVE